MKVGLIGTGAIGTYLLQSLNEEKRIPGMTITAVHSRDFLKTKQIAAHYEATAYETLEDLLATDVDVVVEAATLEVATRIAPKVLRAKKHLVIGSIGSVADEGVYESLHALATREHVHLYLPSGAIGSLDTIRAARASDTLSNVRITTRKPPSALPGEVTEETILFEGTARDAIERFPKNMNVAITLSLAGLGPNETEVRVIADPHVTKNTHTIEASGTFGNMTFIVENEPLPSNPKTSALAAYSLLATLQSMMSSVIVGS